MKNCLFFSFLLPPARRQGTSHHRAMPPPARRFGGDKQAGERPQLASASLSLVSLSPFTSHSNQHPESPNPSSPCCRRPLHIAGESDVLKTGDLVHPLRLVVRYALVPHARAGRDRSRGTRPTSRTPAAGVELDSVPDVAPLAAAPCPINSR